MLITKQMFGGDLDNYHNFKDNCLKASKAIHLASLYVLPTQKNTNLVELDNFVSNLDHRFDPVEFED